MAFEDFKMREALANEQPSGDRAKEMLQLDAEIQSLKKQVETMKASGAAQDEIDVLEDRIRELGIKHLELDIEEDTSEMPVQKTSPEDN